MGPQIDVPHRSWLPSRRGNTGLAAEMTGELHVLETSKSGGTEMTYCQWVSVVTNCCRKLIFVRIQVLENLVRARAEGRQASEKVWTENAETSNRSKVNRAGKNVGVRVDM